MSTPTVSVCLTAYKRGHAIGKTIESLLAQSFGDFELIITDDASPDNTESVCRGFERLDARVRYVRQPANIGMPANLNTGIGMARASLIANLHDGDVYRSDLLQRWKDALDAQPDAAFVFNSYVRLDESGHERGLMSAGLPGRFERLELVRYMLDPARCYSSPVWGTVMGRAPCYREVGGFDPRFGFVSDVALWLRLNTRFPVAYVDAPLIRLHAGEAERPSALLSWPMEQAIVDMYYEAAAAAFPPELLSKRLSRMRRIQERRWLLGLASSIRRERFYRVEEGLAHFARQGDFVLVGAALAARPLAISAKRSQSVRRIIQSAGSLYDLFMRLRR